VVGVRTSRLLLIRKEPSTGIASQRGLYFSVSVLYLAPASPSRMDLVCRSMTGDHIG
jgi:hypothetical protein